ncbi:MAG: hypothetical protein JWN78_151 [Bacteroidota bacterium]|nr:hypothetical protein [Bacteroidota bacterium]
MENSPQDKDQLLWEEARERVRFKRKLTMYFVFSAFFWIIWYFTGQRTYGGYIPWPAWAMLGWGVGLVMRYARISKYSTRHIEEEYERLKNKKG